MCTLAVAYRSVPGFPLVVAANRDERLDRPASPPFDWPRGFWAPRDDAGGGTWVGLTVHSLFVRLTNRFGSAVRRAAPRAGVNPFHLLYAELEAAFVTWVARAERHQAELAPGLHIVTERSLGGDDRARTERIRAQWPAKPTPAALQALLGLHAPEGPDGLGSVCVHADAIGYGTRSSLVLFAGEQPGQLHRSWAEGHPCTAIWR